jgi:hypothetical protein
MPSSKFFIGDLVQFDCTRKLGLVTAIKNAPEFEPPEKIADVKVLWLDGEEFWCLDFTLELVSRSHN